MIRVTIIAPAMAVRAGLRALLGDEPELQVIGEGGSPAELEASQLDVDVLIWCPAPYLDRETLRQQLTNLRLGETSTLLLLNNDASIILLLAGLPVRAWAVLDNEATQAELVASIHALNEGLVASNPVLMRQAFTDHKAGFVAGTELSVPLTERETEILQLLAYGLTNKQIAARLKISAHTVKFHVSTIFNKLGTTNRVETVNLGLKKGLIVL